MAAQSALFYFHLWASGFFGKQALVSAPRKTRLRRVCHQQSGLTIIEVAISVTLLALLGVGGIDALLALNRNATTTRVIAAAREVVQRNMEAAMTVPFVDSTNTIAPILVVNTGIGWNETADVTLGSAPIALVVARDGTVLVSGTLKRTVALLPGTIYHPNTRRVTFTLSYTVNGRTKPDYVLTSIRTPDK